MGVRGELRAKDGTSTDLKEGKTQRDGKKEKAHLG